MTSFDIGLKNTIVYLYIAVFVVLLLLIAFFAYLHEISEFNSEWIESIIAELISIVKLAVGAVIGALTTAYAFEKKA